MVAVNFVSTDETFTDVETLEREGVNATVFEEIRRGVGCALDETSVHEMLRHCFPYRVSSRRSLRLFS